jgi:ComF family protein
MMHNPANIGHRNDLSQASASQWIFKLNYESLCFVFAQGFFIMKRITGLLEPLLNFVIPPVCISCKHIIPFSRKVICEDCFESLPHLSPLLIQTLRNEMEDEQYDDLFILFEFNEILQQLIHLLKYRQFTKMADYFAEAFVQRIGVANYDLVTGVPLNKVRQRERGYNQSNSMAEHYSYLTNTSYNPDFLIRTRNTVSQTQLKKGERIQNVKNAFICTQSLDGMSILVLDDVVTTGSTLNECSRVLKQSGASKIDVAALATPVNFLQSNFERELADLELI